MPIRPYRRTRTGNLFHEWVERRASTARGTSLFLSGLDPEDLGFDPEDAVFDSNGQALAQPQEDLQVSHRSV